MIVRFRLLAAALVVAASALLHAQPLPPALTQPVNDFAHVIDAQHAAVMDRQIRALQAASGDVVIVATIDTFAPYGDIRDYAVRMFANGGRGIGDKGEDNGLLVLLAVKDRRVWVEVGYDLEQFVTDGFAGEVSRNDMAPAFARGDYGAGLEAGVGRLIARIAQGRGVTISGLPEPGGTGDGPGANISVGLFIAFIMVVLLLATLRRSAVLLHSRRHWGGDSWSGWNSGVGPFGGGGRFGGGGFGGGFGGFGGGRSGGGGGGASW